MQSTGKVAVIWSRLWPVLLLALIIPGTAWGAEFSATMMVKDGWNLMPGKIYVHDGKMRQEFCDTTGQTITIVRPDKKVVWVIMPSARTYLEMPLKTRLPGQFIQLPLLAMQKRLVGKDYVAGYETDKYEVTVLDGRTIERQTFWVAAKLGLPIKMECRQRQFSVEYKSIRESQVPDRLFDVPVGYRKATTAQGFDNAVQD
jgi:outer membrane lipoprotein-sorting protein